MLELRESFVCVKNITLTGSKLLAGDRDSNTYIHVKKNMASIFKEFVTMIDSGIVDDIDMLKDDYRKIAKQMDAKGFFKTSKKPKGSFNEINSYARIIYKKEFSIKQKANKNNYLENLLYFVSIIGMMWFVLYSRSFLNRQFDIHSLSMPMVLACVFIVPVSVYLFHEAGHYIAASLLGVPVASLQIGFFITYPTVFLTYRGLNLNTALKKVSILLGGAAGHMAGIVIGIVLMRCGVYNTFIDVWIIGNTSMIFVNLSVFGATDGYYIITTLLGIYNLRLLGYSAIKKVLHRQAPGKKEAAYGAVLLVLWTLSFCGIYESIKMNTSYFNIPPDITFTISIVLIVLLIVRFIYKTYNLKLQ
ncbi:MAG: hypothetical protein LBQ15_10610 [Clostridium sp.]|nr:hypothetical protein [Clostridium sp.]